MLKRLHNVVMSGQTHSIGTRVVAENEQLVIKC